MKVVRSFFGVFIREYWHVAIYISHAFEKQSSSLPLSKKSKIDSLLLYLRRFDGAGVLSLSPKATSSIPFVPCLPAEGILPSTGLSHPQKAIQLQIPSISHSPILFHSSSNVFFLLVLLGGRILAAFQSIAVVLAFLILTAAISILLTAILRGLD